MGSGESGRLVLKVANPTEHPFYIFGFGISDVPHTIEVQKDGRWKEVPRPRSLTLASMSKFLPNSYILFDISLPFLSDDEEITFRVRAFLSTEPDLTSPSDPTMKRYLEIVSQPFTTRDFKNLKPSAEQLKIPGLDPTPPEK
jgi:hypothetical protein